VYYLNRRLGEEHSGTYLSIIIDGMQQSHSKVPYLANQKEFADPVQQHIQGAKQHGFAKKFYRSFSNFLIKFAFICILALIISYS
jgi:hypothetical protein